MDQENRNHRNEISDDEMNDVVGGLVLGYAYCSICGSKFRMSTESDCYLPNGSRVCPTCMAAHRE